MDKEPNNGEVNSDLKYARVAFEKAGGKKKFKKITIVEEEENGPVIKPFTDPN